jgi:hypothetical protein
VLDRLIRFFSLDNPLLFAAAVVLSVVPLWIPEFPPLVDVPQHAAQVASLHELWSNNAFIDSLLTVNWMTPYLGGYLLAYAVSMVLPVVTAIKVVVSLAVVGVPLVTGLLLKDVGADERLKWLAIPGSYSFALYWGFMVYFVAVPVALMLVWLTVRFERNPSVRNSVGIAAFSVLLFFFHVVALGFGALISLIYLLARNLRTPLRLVKCALPYAAPLPLMAIWMTRAFDADASLQDSPVVFAPLRMRLSTLFQQLSGLDGIAFTAGMVIVTAMVLLPFALGYRFSKRPERWLPLVLGLAVYMVFPHYMQNTAYLYQRLGVFLIPLWLMAWDAPERTSPFLAPAVIAVVGLWFGVNTNRFVAFAQESKSFGAVLAKAEPGGRMGGMLFCNSSRSFAYPVYLHFHAWYQATAGGIVDNSFAMTHPSMVRYRDMGAPRIGDYLAWHPEAFEWVRDGGQDYDYFLICAGGDVSGDLFKDRAGSMELMAHEGPWWLYRNRERHRHH